MSPSRDRRSPQALPRRREIQLRLALVILSLTVALIFAEIAVRLISTAARETPAPPPPSYSTYHERLGWDLVPGAADRHRSAEFDVAIRINDQGLRAEREIPWAHPPGTKRLVAIGDSFTFGHGVEVEDTFLAQLETLVPDLETVNLAVNGYGTDQQLLRLEMRGFAWRPDLVVLGLFVGDLFRNARDVYLGYPKPRFTLDDQGDLVLGNVPVPQRPPSSAGDSALWRLVAGRGRVIGEHLGLGEAWCISEKILLELDKRCAEAGAELLIVVIPKDQAIVGTGPRQRLHLHTLARLRTLLEEHDLRFLDLTAALTDHAAKQPRSVLYYPLDGHWTASGHRVAARALAERLTAAGGGEE